MKPPLKEQSVQQLTKARKHLEYSFKKVSRLALNGPLTEEGLESLESFASRFARFSDIGIAKYFRSLALEKDPAFRGSVVDLLNQAEKYGWIESAATWIRIRELRNLAAHEYSPEDYRQLYEELIRLTPELLKLSLSL